MTTPEPRDEAPRWHVGWHIDEYGTLITPDGIGLVDTSAIAGTPYTAQLVDTLNAGERAPKLEAENARLERRYELKKEQNTELVLMISRDLFESAQIMERTAIENLERERDALRERVTQLEDVVQGLIAYGMIQPVEGVRYPGGSHAEYIERARALAGTGEGDTE